MRGKILSMLKEVDGFISGELIAERLGISRTAVWKHISELRRNGYNIESIPNNGYKFVAAPDLLLPDEIRPHLRTSFVGRAITYKTSLTSTNSLAKQLAAKNAPDGTIIIAEEQTAGRGRLSRGWFSPPRSGLWFSVILRPDFFLPADAPKCTLLAAVAVSRAIASLGIEPQIKWPNDILYDGQKLVGILTEMSAQTDGIDYIVIGMGVNANLRRFPAELNATSLALIKDASVNRAALLADILNELEDLYLTVKREGFAPVLDEWRKHSVTLGSEVNVIGQNENFAGRAVDIDEYGALLVDTPQGIRRVLAGDVSIRNRQ